MSGESARKAGDDFEKEIEATFDSYANAGIAMLDFMPVPMRPTGIRHPKTQQPLYCYKHEAPFDVWGFSMIDGRIIVAELKSGKRAPSLPIRMPEKQGHGIKWHQLCGLRNVVLAGGIARLVWSNEGEVGILREEGIFNAWRTANDAMVLESRNKPGGKIAKAKPGSKSIKWEKFEIVGMDQFSRGDTPVLAWLDHHKLFHQFTPDHKKTPSE